MNKISLVFIGMLLLPLVHASITVSKEAPEILQLGEILSVTIHLENSADIEEHLTIREIIGGAEPIDPSAFQTQEVPPGMIAPIPPFYQWELSLLPGKGKDIVYKIRPLEIGMLFLGATKVTTSGGEMYYSDPVTVMVHPAYNGVCEADKGENYMNAPEDCPTGSHDHVCDLIGDGVCDPDCVGDADPDCTPQSSSFCGNGRCEENEDYHTCKEDCQEPVITQNTCGNSRCEQGETFQNCLSDCPSGSDDGYCDGIEDERCDPDCSIQTDLDCVQRQVLKKEIPYLRIVVAFLLFLVIAAVFFVMFQKMRE